MASSVAALDARLHQSTSSFQAARIPTYARALIEALQFSEPNTHALSSLNGREWKRLLQFADRAQLTLIFGKLCRNSLPEWVQARIDFNYCNATKRFHQLSTALVEIADSFEARNIEFIALKGHAHAESFTSDPVLRAQGDIDLWCLPTQVLDARNALLGLGYAPMGSANGRHLPPMVKPSKWSWRGDYFDPDLPMPIDLHYALWDKEETRIAGPAEQHFWERRRQILVAGRRMRVLCEEDTLGFAALHLLMHLLAGDLRLQRAWEIAHFLQTRADDDDFWRRWQALHPAPLRSLEALVFRVCAKWFRCSWPAPLSEETDNLPADVRLWLDRYALRPLEAPFSANKDELWLHLSLLGSRRDRIHVFARRIVPVPSGPKEPKPKPVRDAPDADGGRMLNWKFRLLRMLHHSRTLVPTFAGAIKWWWIRQNFGRDFEKFLMSSALFDFGEFIFFLLFNLYLLARGFDEKFLGQVTSVMTAGTILGALPTVALARRIGLRSTLLLALIGAPLTGALRVLAVDRVSILASSFLMGMFMSIWAVSFAPVVSATTNERNRAFAFSLVSGLGIGLGGLAGLIGGQLPALLQHASPGLGAVAVNRTALLIGCAIALLGAIPMTRASLETTPQREKRSYPRGRFIWTFCIALLIWSFATGAFNPFFNAYFANREQMSVEKIGLIFSGSQLATVVAVLFAPMVLNKLGQVKGVTAMQAATAVALCGLALSLPGAVAAFLYIGYMSFQYMSEPCLFTMLMSRVGIGERSGASALNFLVISAAGSLSALASGAAISRFGYSAMLVCAAALALVAAFLFLTLIREQG